MRRIDHHPNIEGAIDRALRPSIVPGHLRLVTFLTDGYVSNEFETLRTLNDTRGEARLFTIGVGNNVNRYLLGKMGEMGHGFTAYVGPNGNVQGQAINIAERISSPVLNDIYVDLGGFLPANSWSGEIPDLFAGESIQLLNIFDHPGTYKIVVHGVSGRGEVSFPMEIVVGAEAACEVARRVRFMLTQDAAAQMLPLPCPRNACHANYVESKWNTIPFYRRLYCRAAFPRLLYSWQ